MEKSHTHKINEPLQGTVGESHLWDGPLDTSGFPMPYSFEPITQRAKGKI